MKTSIKIPAMFLMVVVYSSVVQADIFSNSRRLEVGTMSAGGTSASTIFQKHIGVANPVRWARQLPGTVNSETFLSSRTWQATRGDFLRTYGNNTQVNQYLTHQEYLFRKAIRINNKAHFRSLDIKGNLAESLMDDFYVKDGWEIIDGKRGRNGFDGLYVRRNKNGTITDWIAADAKSGTSKLKMTSRGMQLSQEWVNGNLKDLLAMAEDEYRRSPSATTKQRITDLKQIMKTRGRTPRVFAMRIENNGGKIQYRIENIGINGTPVGKPMFVNMNTNNSGTMLRMEQAIYKNLEKHISVYNPKGSAALVKKIQQAFKKGTIKSDSDLYRFIKREIPDKRLAMAVTQELGEIPPRGNLASNAIRYIKTPGVYINIALVIGFTIAHDAMRDGITSETFFMATLTAAGGFAVGVAFDYGLNLVAPHVSKYVAKYILQHTGKKVTEKAIEKFAIEILPTVGKGIGGLIQVVFAGAFITKSVYDYNQNNISQTDMFVEVGIVAVTTGASIFFTCTEAGAAIGTAIFPGLGSAGGLVIGSVVGVVGGFASGVYTWYVENQRQEMVLLEARQLAAWETENNKVRLQQRISDLKKESEQMWNDAWKGLLPAAQ